MPFASIRLVDGHCFTEGKLGEEMLEQKLEDSELRRLRQLHRQTRLTLLLP